MTIGGNVCIRNGISLDYCWQEAVLSLLPVCDEVVICDGESTDGTREAAEEMAAQDDRIRVITYPWPNPRGDALFWVRWLNYCREQITAYYHLQLDGDEVLGPESHEAIREAAKHPDRVLYLRRHTFWLDTAHVVPRGHLLSPDVVRFGPARLFMPSDAPMPEAAELLSLAYWADKPAVIYHYGFLRKPECFFAKQKAYQGAASDTYDPRLAAMEHLGRDWMQARPFECPDGRQVPPQPWSGEHPELMHPWLRERGWEV